LNILFDIDMGKWALFFTPIIKKLQKNHNIIITSRSGKGYTELNDLLNLYKINYISIGEFGGADLENKLKASINRQLQLIKIIKKHSIEKIVSGSVVDSSRVGFGLGIDVINFYDMPIKGHSTNLKLALPQIKLSIPLSTKVFKPFIIPDEIYLRLGLEKEQIIEYQFIDPLIWLKDFKFDKNYVKNFYEKYNIDRSKFTIMIREEEYKASYVNKKYPFLYEAIPKIYKKFDANIIIIPRYESEYLKKEFPFAYVIEEKIYLQHLLKDADLFIGGGGTINTESCFLGTQTISTRSFISHYDKWQIDNKLMYWTNNKNELLNLVKEASQFQLIPNTKILKKMKVDIDMLIKEIVT
jgi:predicted glycosyltransferase